MQRYQVFIDEHSISFSEKRKRNQQLPTVFELVQPDLDIIKLTIEWLKKEKKEPVEVCFIDENVNKLWETFKGSVKFIEAAGGIVKNKEGEILFIYRLDKWDLPKGKIEKGEDQKTAAIREVEEECGITNLKIEKELVSTYHMYEHKGEDVLKKTYWFLMNYDGNEKLTPQIEEQIERVCWVDPKNTEEQASNTYASLKRLMAFFLNC